MTADRTHAALDAAHAVLLAAWEATRFYTDPELGGLVGRLRRTAAAANQATVRACKDPGPRQAHLIGATALLRELAECIEAARRRGLDLAAATELMEYQTQASVTLAALLDRLEDVTARAA